MLLVDSTLFRHVSFSNLHVINQHISFFRKNNQWISMLHHRQTSIEFSIIRKLLMETVHDLMNHLMKYQYVPYKIVTVTDFCGKNPEASTFWRSPMNHIQALKTTDLFCVLSYLVLCLVKSCLVWSCLVFCLVLSCVLSCQALIDLTDRN